MIYRNESGGSWKTAGAEWRELGAEQVARYQARLEGLQEEHATATALFQVALMEWSVRGNREPQFSRFHHRRGSFHRVLSSATSDPTTASTAVC